MYDIAGLKDGSAKDKGEVRGARNTSFEATHHSKATHDGWQFGENTKTRARIGANREFGIA